MGIPIQSAHVPLLAEIGVTPIRRVNRRPESSWCMVTAAGRENYLARECDIGA
jgi:hypothetical protein